MTYSELIKRLIDVGLQAQGNPEVKVSYDGGILADIHSYDERGPVRLDDAGRVVIEIVT